MEGHRTDWSFSDCNPSVVYQSEDGRHHWRRTGGSENQFEL